MDFDALTTYSYHNFVFQVETSLLTCLSYAEKKEANNCYLNSTLRFYVRLDFGRKCFT